mgnify:CR=1 FL=1
MSKDKKDRPIEVIARGVLVCGGKVLLCRSVEHGYLYLPGGHVDFGESAAAAVRRELIEEAGLRVEVGELGLVTEAVFEARGKRHHEINLVFHVEPSREEGQWGGDGGAASSSSPSPPPPVQSLEPEIAFDWVDLAAMPDTDVRPAAVRAWLATLGRSGPSAATAEWVSEVL